MVPGRRHRIHQDPQIPINPTAVKSKFKLVHEFIDEKVINICEYQGYIVVETERAVYKLQDTEDCDMVLVEILAESKPLI